MLYEHIEQEKSKECLVLGRTNIKEGSKTRGFDSFPLLGKTSSKGLKEEKKTQ
jgi:hypothetical protein